MDIVDRQTRSRMMAGIRGKNTKPELALRKGLHALGFRYRLHSSRVIGKPDLIFPRYNAVVFVHGCFWHWHEGCQYATTPATRPDFWQAKFDSNVARDQKVREQLLNDGWRVATVWECALRGNDRLHRSIHACADWLKEDHREITIDPALPDIESTE